jgi:EAL domain-containing protein (putative c-di-GMP-specific phosphodiesterase class I)
VFKDGAVAGIEALARWSNPRLGEVSPGEFIPVAEESSAIIGLGDWVLSESCRQLRALADAGHAGLFVAMNVAEAQLARVDFPERVSAALSRHGLAPSQLELEITERTLMADTPVHQQNLLALRALGVRLSVDDFGTGYSSLAYLTRFPVDKIKVDRSFVAALGDDGQHAEVVRAIIALAGALRLDCVAEGVETPAQREALERLGCRGMQGYLLARPMGFDGLVAWLSTLRPPLR